MTASATAQIDKSVEGLIEHARSIGDLASKFNPEDPNDPAAWRSVFLLRQRLVQVRGAVATNCSRAEKHLRDVERRLGSEDPRQGNLFRSLGGDAPPTGRPKLV